MMTDENNPYGEETELRKRAEFVFRRKAARSAEYLEPLTPQAARSLLHELRVHQIELEMQNEELRRANLELDAVRESYLDLYDLAPIGYITLNEQGLISQANLAVASQTRTNRNALLMKPISNIIFKGDQDIFYLLRKRLFDSGLRQDCELRMVRSDGSLFWTLMQATVRQNCNGVPELRIVMTDITERKRSADYIKHLAHFDVLTGLPNRAQLAERAHYAMSLAQRANESIALMFIDLDHFKDINDTLGHTIGDVLLVELANRLRQLLRETDTVSRLGGDEFIFMFYGIGADGAAQVAQKVLDVIASPFRIEQHDLNITGSIGIALYPNDGSDLETLLRRADAAMYRVKREGRHGYCFFTPEMQTRSARHLQIVNALRQALDRNQFTVHFQPQVSAQDNSLIGAEALLRWTHPELGAVSPAEFIPAAEDSGLINSIGEWVLRQSVRQAKLWIQLGLAPLVIAVNISAVQFRQIDLPDLVTRILDEEGLPSGYLELELTEGIALHDPAGAILLMQKLHERGVRMSIDDFGTGYSSLGNLKKFKVYKLKIDQSFVRDIGISTEDRAIISAIISMAKSLGLRTIAEGVETEDQLKFLREQNCDEFQGYYYGKPLPADEFMALAQSVDSKFRRTPH
jgi:diguanylate cyclase (GGDEF)-like protein/PAS domain S-box-containing protein